MKPLARVQMLLLCLTSAGAMATTDVDLHHVIHLEGHGARTVIL